MMIKTSNTELDNRFRIKYVNSCQAPKDLLN